MCLFSRILCLKSAESSSGASMSGVFDMNIRMQLASELMISGICRI